MRAPRASGRATVAWLVALLAAPAAACGPDGPSRDDVLTLRREVNALRDSVAGRNEGPAAAVAPAGADPGDVVIGLRTSMVASVLSAASRRYLDDVRLHLEDDIGVTTRGDVKVGLGLFDVSVGSWDLAVTIERIVGRLRADSILLSVPDSQRLAVEIPVRILDGSGEAVIDFRWDASRVTGVVCGDFELRERFTGTVEPNTQRIRGHFRLVSDSAGVRAVPTVENRPSVSPVPTPDAWRRVRAILAEQDRIFNCGLAISKEGMERRLRELLARGFRFSLPSSIVRPAPLPASLADRVEVAGRSVAVTVDARPPRLDSTWVWISGAISVAGGGAPSP